MRFIQAAHQTVCQAVCDAHIDYVASGEYRSSNRTGDRAGTHVSACSVCSRSTDGKRIFIVCSFPSFCTGFQRKRCAGGKICSDLSKQARKRSGRVVLFYSAGNPHARSSWTVSTVLVDHPVFCRRSRRYHLDSSILK